LPEDMLNQKLKEWNFELFGSCGTDLLILSNRSIFPH